MWGQRYKLQLCYSLTRAALSAKIHPLFELVTNEHTGSYTFAFPRKAGEKSMIRYMLPLMDKMNHASPEAATAYVRRDFINAEFLVVAIKDIQMGEEV